MSVASKLALLVFVAGVVVAVLIALSPWLAQPAAQMGMPMMGMHWAVGGQPTAALLLAVAVLAAFTAIAVVILVALETASRPEVPPPGGAVEKGQPRPTGAYRVLKGDEKMVVEVLKREGGRALQKDIVWETGLPKVGVHRVLKRMNERGLVEIHRMGRTNEVVLSEWFAKELGVKVREKRDVEEP